MPPLFAKKNDAPHSPIVIAGAGAAGMGCALSAAMQGMEVILIEKSPNIGGTVTQALIHTIGGLFDDNGEQLNSGLPTILLERLFAADAHTKKRQIGKTWVLDVSPQVYSRVVEEWISSFENIHLFCNSEITQVKTDKAGHIQQIQVNNKGEGFTLEPHMLIDTTGNAHIISQIDPTLVDEGQAQGACILQIRGAAIDALRFPAGVAILREIRKSARQGYLPKECETVWLDTGIESDEIYAKLNLSVDNYHPESTKKIAEQLLLFLRDIPGLEECYLQTLGALGIRDGGRVKGKYQLTETDVMSGKQFSDAACLASWPIEHWHPQQGITLEYLPANQPYSIPIRCLMVDGFDNLWAAGKCLSAEPRAQASARVVGTCWSMGEAVGNYIARSAK